MRVPMGKRELEWGTQLGELRECNGILDDLPALHQSMADNGYLLIRGLHDRQTVLKGRRAVFEFAQQQMPDVFKPGTDLMDAVINPAKRFPPIMGKKGVTHHPDLLAVLEGKPIFDFFGRYFGEPALTFNYKWMRALGTGEYSGGHIDIVYMGRGATKNLFTCWTPLGDVPLEMGPLSLCVGSHNLPGFQKLRDTYGKMDVDRDRVGGWFTEDFLEVTDRFGGQWQTSNFEAGDVLIFTMWTMHGSVNNTTDRYRLSSDTRFQPASEPVDERWIGENPKSHYAWQAEPEKVISMEQARKDWGV